MKKLLGAIGGAALIGLSGFFPVWVQEADVKVLVSAFGGPFVAYLVAYYRITRPAA